MKIKHNRSYLYLYEHLKSIFSFEQVDKICFEGKSNDKDRDDIKNILEYLNNNYKMYQYKNNSIRFGEEDLFYWSNGTGLYFDITLKNDNNRISNEILKFLNDNYSDSNIYVSFQYNLSINWDLVHSYLRNDNNYMNYYDIGILYNIYHNQYDYRKYFTNIEVEKINSATNTFMSQFNNKKVLLKNGIKGTIRYIDTMDRYGLFKPKSRNKCILLSLIDVQGLEIIKNFK